MTATTVTGVARTVVPLTGTFGAEIRGVDLSEPFDAAWLRDQLHDHRVLVFRDQDVDRPTQVRLGSALGPLTPAHPVVPGDGDFPEILELDAAEGGRNARWHTDVTFVPEPPAYSVLVAEVVPPHGGDTLWADLRTAYERLAPSLRSTVDQLEAVHRITPLAYWGEPFDTGLRREDAADLLARAATVPPVIHPVVRIHPATGRPNLFVNPGFTSHLVGLSRIESEHLLALLYAHETQPELTLRHHWRSGDVVMWDNHSTLHYAVDDYPGSSRRMRRVTVRGDAPRGPYGGASRVSEDPLVTVR